MSKTLHEILDDGFDAGGNPPWYWRTEKEILAWHKAELERYGEKVKEACLDLVRKEPCEVYPAVLASDMKAMPLPPIEQEGASRE